MYAAVFLGVLFSSPRRPFDAGARRFLNGPKSPVESAARGFFLSVAGMLLVAVNADTPSRLGLLLFVLVA